MVVSDNSNYPTNCLRD